MLKLLELLSRRNEDTHDEAMTYWTQKHAARAKQGNQARPLTRRYVNNVGLATGYGGRTPFATCPFDGIVEVWMDRTMTELQQLMNSGASGVIPDERNFLRCPPYLMPVEEQVHKRDAATARTKLMVLGNRPLGATRDEFVRRWREEHVPRELEFWGERLIKLTTNVAAPFTWSEWGEQYSAFDGCAEYGFTIGADEVIAAYADYPDSLVASQDACLGPTARLFVREVVQIDTDPELG
jgi:hypothetical protein